MSQWPGLVGAGNDVERCFYRAFGFNTGMGWRDKERQAGRERAREREKKSVRKKQLFLHVENFHVLLCKVFQ